MYTINAWFISNSHPVKNKLHVLILGDSHTQRAINPDLFKNAMNISQLAEPLVISYWKLRATCDQLNPDTVILGVAPHNLSAFNDFKFDNNWATEMYSRTYGIASFQEHAELTKFSFETYIRILWKNMAVYPKLNHKSYYGAFSNENSSHPGDWPKTINRHYFSSFGYYTVSELSVRSLNMIIEFCESRGITLILINTPVHQKYYNHIPSKFTKAYDSIVQEFSERCIILNYAETDYEDSLFLNSDHLNLKGAMKFTKQLIGEWGYSESSPYP